MSYGEFWRHKSSDVCMILLLVWLVQNLVPFLIAGMPADTTWMILTTTIVVKSILTKCNLIRSNWRIYPEWLRRKWLRISMKLLQNLWYVSHQNLMLNAIRYYQIHLMMSMTLLLLLLLRSRTLKCFQNLQDLLKSLDLWTSTIQKYQIPCW